MFASTKAVPRLISAFPRHHIPEMLMNSASSVYSVATASASCLLKASSKDASTLRTAVSSFAVLATPGFVIVITSITNPTAIFFMATSEEPAYGSADCKHQKGDKIGEDGRGSGRIVGKSKVEDGCRVRA